MVELNAKISFSDNEINYDTFRKPNNYSLLSYFDVQRQEYRLDILDLKSQENLYRRIIRMDHEIVPFVNILLNENKYVHTSKTKINRLEKENNVLKHDIRILENEITLLKNQIKQLEDKDEKTNKEYAYVEGWDDF